MCRIRTRCALLQPLSTASRSTLQNWYCADPQLVAAAVLRCRLYKPPTLALCSSATLSTQAPSQLTGSSFRLQIIKPGGVLDRNFALLGPGDTNAGEVLLKESMHEFKLWASGRRYCQVWSLDVGLLHKYHHM